MACRGVLEPLVVRIFWICDGPVKPRRNLFQIREVYRNAIWVDEGYCVVVSQHQRYVLMTTHLGDVDASHHRAHFYLTRCHLLCY